MSIFCVLIVAVAILPSRLFKVLSPNRGLNLNAAELLCLGFRKILFSWLLLFCSIYEPKKSSHKKRPYYHFFSLHLHYYYTCIKDGISFGPYLVTIDELGNETDADLPLVSSVMSAPTLSRQSRNPPANRLGL